MNAKLYVEGGGDSKVLKTECRKGFRMFLERAGLAGNMPGIVACGSRQKAYDSFETAHASQAGVAMLVVDAEGPVTASGPWQHLKARDGWDRPDAASDDQCHLMVQVMESWFLADSDALESFYGQGFRPQSLPANPNTEKVSKQDVFNRLDAATRATTKGRYDKGRHSYEILGRLDPSKVTNASPYAGRLIRVLSS